MKSMSRHMNKVDFTHPEDPEVSAVTSADKGEKSVPPQPEK
jgi:hypothetical protein